MKPYQCAACGVTDVKMWRGHGPSYELKCCACAHNEQRKDRAEFDLDECDQIGQMVPAIRDHDGTWWGYGAIPQYRYDEWKALPFEPSQAPPELVDELLAWAENNGVGLAEIGGPAVEARARRELTALFERLANEIGLAITTED